MTVPTEAALAALAWTGVETSFSPGFRAQSVDAVKVIAEDVAGAQTTLTRNVHFAAALDGAGAVTVTPIALPAQPQSLIIYRDTPATQGVDFANLGDFAPATHTQLHDAAALRDAELKRDLARAVLVPLGDSGLVLPPPASRVNTALAFGADGALQLAPLLTTGVLDAAVTPTWTGLHTFNAGIVVDGPVRLTAAYAGVEIGALLSANTPVFDGHSSGFNNDYDARLLWSGGVNGTAGRGTLSVYGIFDLVPAPNTLDPALLVTQTAAGTVVADYYLNKFSISEGLVAGSNRVIGLGVVQSLPANSLRTGERRAFSAEIHVTGAGNASNPTPYYTALFGFARGDATDIFNTSGLFAGNYNVLLTGGSWEQVSACEFDMTVLSGVSIAQKIGLPIVLSSVDAVAGTDIDAGISFYAAPGTTPGWKDGILFDATPNKVMATNGTLIRTRAAQTIANGIDLTSATITGDAIKTPGFRLTGVGYVGINLAADPLGPLQVKTATNQHFVLSDNTGLTISAVNDAGSGRVSLNMFVASLLLDAPLTCTAAILSTGSGGIGYAPGAGAAVTQTTSRTTGVTINKPTGAITLVSAAGSTTPATFTVTNSTVAATDTVDPSQKSGTDKYILQVTHVAAGSFDITAWTTGGTTTEQPVINFNVVKGAAT